MRAFVMISCLTVAATAGVALGADQKVPSQHATIQAAVDAAGPGDRILVSKGAYKENVVANVAGLQFLGKRAVWDGNIAGVNGVCLTANGANILVQGFKFRNGTTQVAINGNGAKVQKCLFRHARNWAVDITGDDAIVHANRFHAVEDGVEIDGDDALVQKNRFQQTECTAVDITGVRATVQKNTMLTTWDDDSIAVTGNDARILKNRITNSYVDMIVTSGTGILIQGNRLMFCDEQGIDHTGDNCTIDRNTVVGTNDAGIEADGDNVTVTRNKVSMVMDDDGLSVSSRTAAGGGLIERNVIADIIGDGLALDIDNVTVRGNTALRCGVGSDAAFSVVGGGNTLDSNRAIEGTDGFTVSGAANTIRNSLALDSARDGFRISGAGNMLDRVTAKGSEGEGLENRGTNTELTNSTLTGNRIDIANDTGGGATFAGGLTSNRFNTGGETTDPEVD